jgi:hypothetical protein
MWRIGIRNDSDAVIRRSRVVVESITYYKDGLPVPMSPDAPAPIEHALNVMGIDKKTGYVNLSPGDRPTAYIDVVEQFIPDGHDPEQWMSLCYATGHRVRMHAGAKWLVGLRAEGGTMFCRATICIEGSEDQKEIVMTLSKPSAPCLKQRSWLVAFCGRYEGHDSHR